MDRRDWNPLYVLRYDTAAGEVVKPGLLASDLLTKVGPEVNAMGLAEEAWDIAVINESGTDVTGRFSCFT